MTTKKKIIITCISVIIIALTITIFLVIYKYIGAKDITITNFGITDNQQIPYFLIDDNINGFSWCTDTKILKQFKKYKLVKKIYTYYTWEDNPYINGNIYEDNIPTYHIEVRYKNMDYSKLIQLIEELNRKWNQEDINKVERRINILPVTRNLPTDIVWYSYDIWNLLQNSAWPVNIIHRDCSLENYTNTKTMYIPSSDWENKEIYYWSDDTIKSNLEGIKENTEILSRILSWDTNINNLINKLGDLNIHYSIDSGLVEKIREYKGWEIRISYSTFGGNWGSFWLSYTKNIWKKIYLLESYPFLYSNIENFWEWFQNYNNIYSDEEMKYVVKNFKCQRDEDCKVEYYKYIGDLLNGKETFPEYKRIYNNFIKTIDEVFWE